MDIVLEREELLKPLQAINGIVEKKQTLPILSNVLLTIKDNRLCLTGTDLEIEFIGFAPIKTLDSEGSTTVSAKKLFDICRTLPEGCMIRLSMEKDYLSIRAGESYFMLNVLSSQDFPNLEESDYNIQFKLKQNSLKNLLTKTYFAMGQQDVRHYLNGAYFDIGQGSIKCVTADGHRLALTAIEENTIGNTKAAIILPRKSVIELIRLVSADNDKEVMIYISDTRFRLVTSDFIFTSKLINAQYPDYVRLIPRGQVVASGDREAIKQALIRASILSNEKFRGVRFELEPGKLCIRANNSDQEHAEEVVTLDYQGNKMQIGFNVAYLLDVVSTLTEKCIRFYFTDANSGVLIEPMDSDHSKYVVMPMRL